MTYAEKLLDPRWQKKRLAVLEKAGWECERCGGRRLTLHVHHGYYAKGLDPWEYDESTLHCLCVECHPRVQWEMSNLYEELARCHTDKIGFVLRALFEIIDREKEDLMALLESLPEKQTGACHEWATRVPFEIRCSISHNS